MLKNYIKLTFKIMLRKKYYTALTLIGISLTIMIITIFASFIDQIVSANKPEINRDRTLILDKLSIYKNGEKTSATPSINLLQKNIGNLESTERISYFTGGRGFISFLNGKTAGHILVFTDDNFWKITDFEFIEGKPFYLKEVKKGTRVAVINEKTRSYFFNEKDALSKSISILGLSYEVIGVVKSATPFSKVYADVYVPYTTDADIQRTNKTIDGAYNALLLAKTKDLRKVRTELKNRLRKNTFSEADSVKAHAFTVLEQFSKSSSADDDEPQYGKTAITVFIVLALFMLIPAISLVNLNVTRIGERAEEIGVRKSFGATSGNLVGQLVIENIIITLIGGMIGLGLSVYASQLLVHFINTFDPLFKMETGSFTISWRVFGFCLFSCLLLGLISGVYPAWKMSRMNVVYALKGGNNL